jgi:hypothetical protein
VRALVAHAIAQTVPQRELVRNYDEGRELGRLILRLQGEALNRVL